MLHASIDHILNEQMSIVILTDFSFFLFLWKKKGQKKEKTRL